jgi:RNA recognition motif-containing protein
MTSIFVAKLDFNTTDEQLKSLFEAHGKVNRVTIAKDRETGKPRGFAFVEMFNEDEANSAVQALDEHLVNGRPIAVKLADDRGQKPQGDRPQRPQGDRPPRQDFKPRGDFQPRNNEYKSDYKSNDDKPAPRTPIVNPEDLQTGKVERKKETKSSPKASDTPKKPKMEAYRKSGKDNQFLDDDDLTDEELDLFGRNSDEEEDEDYRKYLINSDDDLEEDDWDDDEDYEEDDED